MVITLHEKIYISQYIHRMLLKLHIFDRNEQFTKIESHHK